MRAVRALKGEHQSTIRFHRPRCGDATMRDGSYQRRSAAIGFCGVYYTAKTENPLV
jgi:hypothetical protein